MKAQKYDEIIKEKQSFKKVKIKSNKYENNDENKFTNKKIINIFSYVFLILIIIIQFIIIYNSKAKNKYHISENIKRKYDINFKYGDYEKDIVPDKENKLSNRQMELEEVQFINGIIRKNKIKKCLEVGVAFGGSSITILNAIKDIENSVLVSLDLGTEIGQNKPIGYEVNENFPDLAKNWKLYTGDLPHKFLVNLNMKFDFVLLDTMHVSPGEILNWIEVLPFLNENAIVVIHDIFSHFWSTRNYKFYPSCINLIPTLYGDKVFLRLDNGNMSNIGAVFLYPNQEEHYLDYFLLLLNFWEYIPKEEQLNDLRIFIQKYYKDDKYINIFDIAVRENKASNQKFTKSP